MFSQRGSRLPTYLALAGGLMFLLVLYYALPGRPSTECTPETVVVPQKCPTCDDCDDCPPCPKAPPHSGQFSDAKLVRPVRLAPP